ncbi:hypothetical protein BASA60_005077 [Batrachochytrium salamandrivorans]|nr:hypothetical protein BASA60_005077 [Batrachochytrium salamandrivorans]KAH9270368.1 hypothetical protein BASA83_007528 [Batrachochytrium salamandrivorans]
MKVINIIVVSGLAVLHGVTADPTSRHAKSSSKGTKHAASMPDTMSIPANLQTPDMLTAQQICDQVLNQMEALSDNYNTCKAEYIKLKNLQEDEERKGIKGEDSELPTRRHMRTVSTKLENAENERDRYIGAIRNVELASAILIRELGENGDRKFSEWVA